MSDSTHMCAQNVLTCCGRRGVVAPFHHLCISKLINARCTDRGQSPNVCVCVLCDSGAAACAHVRYCRRGDGLQAPHAFRMSCFMSTALFQQHGQRLLHLYTRTHKCTNKTHKTHNKRPEITAPTGTAAAFILLLCGATRGHTHKGTTL